MIATLLPLVIQLLSMTPQIVSGAEDFVWSVETLWNVATAGNPPSADEQSQYDAALDAAHAALQAS